MAYKRRLKFDKRIRFKKKMDMMYILLLIVLASLGTGYAYIKSNLNITGTANVTAANWSVHFDNLNVTDGSVTAETEANITDDTTVEFAATLEEPGDFYEFTVDVENEGTMDAMIDSFSISPELTTAQAKYLEYTVTYSDGTPLVNKQELKKETTETLKVRFSYIENEDKTNYPTEDQSFTIEFTVSYTQADGSETEVPHQSYVYTVNLENETLVEMGQAISNNITQYSSASDAMAAFSNRPFYLKHLVRNGIVEESYLEFIVTDALAQANPEMTAGTYALRGFETYDSSAPGNCKAEYYTGGYCINPYYEANKATLISAFGSWNCGSEYSIGTFKGLACAVSGFEASAGSNGTIGVGNYEWYCNVYSYGNAGCSYDDK